MSFILLPFTFSSTGTNRSSPCPPLNFWPQDPIGTPPICPLAPEIAVAKTSHTCTDTQSPTMTSRISRVCALCVCVCVAAYLCLHRQRVESQSAEAPASALHGLTSSQTSLLLGNCALQHKQLISHSSVSVLAANPGASLRGTKRYKHPHSFKSWLSSSPLVLIGFFSHEIFKSIVSQGHSAVAFVLNIAMLIYWVATVMIP